ncbi:MAG TPA: hypothetical protein DF984_01525 [Anaerolineaceae bacterium]|nr:hypothetical protein [Anaerolineaceae bacterium]
MPEGTSLSEYRTALEDFRRARQKAEVQHLWASLTGRSDQLLEYDDITQKLHARGFSSKGVQEIPVDAIVGSVNRFQDFNRDFMPLYDQDQERWARVKAAMTSPGSAGLPPIRVYKLGDAYFVLDGNHRVSIAREMGIATIEADVTEIRSRVPLSPDDSPSDLILKEEYVDFLEKTMADKIVSETEFILSFPGLYKTLEEHITVHRHYMGIEQSREIPWEEAVRDWYENVYLPIIKEIRDQDLLKEFPTLTETDLYIWILDHQTYLQAELGWAIRPEKAATDLVGTKKYALRKAFHRFGRRIVETLLPRQMEDYAAPGEWHAFKQLDEEPLFADILVAMSGKARSWITLEQAVTLGSLEGSDVRGLVVLGEDEMSAYNQDSLAQAFKERLDYSGLTGNLVFSTGSISDTIIQRARVNDLVVLQLTHPPETRLFARLESGIRRIVRRCSRPILMVRDQVSSMKHMLVAYDGSPKSKEALFVAEYLARRYHKKLTLIVTEEETGRGDQLLEEAMEILGDTTSQGVVRQNTGRVSDVILHEARKCRADLILMGGYGYPPLLEALFGSTVDDVLRRVKIPILICQ